DDQRRPVRRRLRPDVRPDHGRRPARAGPQLGFHQSGGQSAALASVAEGSGLRRAARFALEAAVPLAVLLGWGIWSAGAGSFFFPPLTDILRTFRETWLFGRFTTDVLPSLERM